MGLLGSEVVLQMVLQVSVRWETSMCPCHLPPPEATSPAEAQAPGSLPAPGVLFDIVVCAPRPVEGETSQAPEAPRVAAKQKFQPRRSLASLLAYLSLEAGTLLNVPLLHLKHTVVPQTGQRWGVTGVPSTVKEAELVSGSVASLTLREMTPARGRPGKQQ